MKNIHLDSKVDTERLSVSQLSNLIKDRLHHAFSQDYFWIVGEVSDLRQSHGNFIVFSLLEKDPSFKWPVKLKVVGSSAFLSSLKVWENEVGSPLVNGLQVSMKISVDYHTSFGVQLEAHQIDVNYSLGVVLSSKERNLKKLLDKESHRIYEKNGVIITPNKNVVITPFIRRIGLVSNRNAAGYEDFIHSLFNNPYGFEFEVAFMNTKVQGDDAPHQMFKALRDLHTFDIDVAVLVRGGGSETDLVCFNDYHLMRAVSLCKFPVITGVGHERNETGVDLVSHKKVKTPTQAAEFITQHNHRFVSELHDTYNDIRSILDASNKQFESDVDVAWGSVMDHFTNSVQSGKSDISLYYDDVLAGVSNGCLYALQQTNTAMDSVVNQINSHADSKRNEVLFIQNDIGRILHSMTMDKQATADSFERIIHKALSTELDRNKYLVDSHKRSIADFLPVTVSRSRDLLTGTFTDLIHYLSVTLDRNKATLEEAMEQMGMISPSYLHSMGWVYLTSPVTSDTLKELNQVDVEDIVEIHFQTGKARAFIISKSK